jgi:hypothetical protein
MIFSLIVDDLSNRTSFNQTTIIMNIHASPDKQNKNKKTKQKISEVWAVIKSISSSTIKKKII